MEYAFCIPSQAIYILSLSSWAARYYTFNISLLSLLGIAFPRLQSKNYCAALPSNSVDKHFKDLLKCITAFASEDIALNGTWCPINKVSLQMIFLGKALLVSFLLFNTKNSIMLASRLLIRKHRTKFQVKL